MDRMKQNADVAARLGGMVGDLHTLKAGTAATADELREFVKQLKGKNPQEMLGLVAQSGLFIGVMQATVATVLVIGMFTVGPYLWNKSNPPAASTQATLEAPSATKGATEIPKRPAAATVPGADPSATAVNDKSKQPAIDKADKGKVLEKLGMDEAKKADPNANPLENKADDLLKDLK